MNKISDEAIAIKILTDLKNDADKDGYKQLSFALQVAIRSLEHPNIVSCENCMSRDNPDSIFCKNCYRKTEYVDNHSLRKLGFDEFVRSVTALAKERSCAEFCENGVGCGGPGFDEYCECKVDPEIRYGHKYCPEHCKNFEMCSPSRLEILYKYHKRS